MRKGISTPRAQRLRQDSTDAERLLWRELRAHRLFGWKFRRQQPVGNYIVDFVCFETQVVVELDGGQHSERITYDAERSTWLTAQGFRVLRFWNHDVLQNSRAVVETIMKECGRATSVSEID